MPDDIHPHLKNYKHTGPWESLPVCYLGELDLRFFLYIHVKNGVGFRTENMSCEKQGIWDEAFSMFAVWKLADSTEWAISNNELREAVDFSRRRRRRSVVEWQCSINWSLIAFSSEYLSKSQCSPSRRSRVTYWAIDSFGAWWAWRKVCYLNWKLFWGGKCVFSAVSASV